MPMPMKPALSTVPLKPRIKLVQLTDVEEKPIDWLWSPYIPRGALTLIIGDGGYGKSWMTCAIAADLSAGRPLPGQEAMPPQKIIMLGAEDGLSQVVKPKMRMLNANMANIRAFDEGFVLDKGYMDDLCRAIREYDAAIVFLDPLVVYLGGKVDMFRANEARSMLTLLKDVAQYTNTALVAVHHVRKSSEGSQQHKVMGSADFVNGVRSTLLVDVSSGGQRYMAHVKSNWAANGPTLAYNFGQQGFQWQGLYDGAEDSAPEVSRTPRGVARDWLKEKLREGPVPAQTMIDAAEAAGFSERTVARAKQGLVASRNIGGLWVWELTDDALVAIQQAEGAIVAAPEAEAAISALGQAPFSNVPSPPADDGLTPAARAMLAARGARQ